MEQETTQLQICTIEFKQLLQNATDIKIKIVGIIKSVFAAKKYIIEVFVKDQVKIRTLKKYDQFQATYQVIKMKFRNFDVGSFPSKYQVFGKDQTRKQYFEWLMNKIIHNYVENPENEASKRLFSILYLFMTRSMVHKQQYPKQLNQQSQSMKRYEKKRKLSLTQTNSEYTEPTLKPKTSIKQSMELSDTKPNNLTQYEKQRHRVRRNSQGSIIFGLEDALQQKNNIQHNLTGITNEQTEDKTLSFNSGLKNSSGFSKKDDQHCYFQIRFESQNQWRKRYLKIQHSSLLIFRDRMENHFRTKIELYRIQVEYFHRQKNFFDHFCQKMQINNEPEFPEDTSVITLSHEYDYQKLFIRGLSLKLPTEQRVTLEQIKQFELHEQMKLETFKDLLQKASRISPIREKFQGVFNPIGKIFLVIHKLTVKNIDKSERDIILKINIKTTNLSYECKKVILKEENIIKQAFLIPISNAFQTISIEVVVSRQQGWIREQFKDFNLGYHQIEFSQILTKSSGDKLQKINVALNKAADIASQYSNADSFLSYSLENHSHSSSIYGESFANENDGKIISGLKLGDMDELGVTVDRALRIIGNVALFIINFWRNVYLFKYPKLGRTFFSILLMLTLFADIKIFITVGFVILILAILYNNPKLNKALKIILNQTLFKQIHPDFATPLCLGTSQIKYRKWCQALDDIAQEFQFSPDNRLEKRQNLQKQSVIEYKFTVHERTFRVTEEVKGILGKVFEGKKVIQVVSRIISGVVNSIEKFCNLFLWVDTRRTVLFLIILVVFSGVANDFLIRILVSIFCVHRLYKGMNFYKLKHYTRNRKVVIYTLRYILKKHFPYLIQLDLNQPPSLQNQKIIEKKRNFQTVRESKILMDLDQAVCLTQFPLSDQNALKKLKAELEKLICVYLDIDELRQSYALQNSKDKTQSIFLGTIVRIIETCETRLALDWVPGKEGLSNQFQQLKHETKQPPLIDVWLEHLVVNFILNIPSQLFVKLKSKQPPTANN